ncbi:MAG: methyltransferase domain-containing protein [Planctomycetota bacterium]
MDLKPLLPDHKRARALMVQNQLVARGIKNQAVLNAFLKVPRHLFIKSSDLLQAYEDHPLSIGLGQTISQPYMVAYMLELLELTCSAKDRKGHEKILEIGTGSGYQTALLAEMTGPDIHRGEIYTIERIPELAENARRKLTELGYTNINFKIGDGTLGWFEEAHSFGRLRAVSPSAVSSGPNCEAEPFDRIIVSAGSPKIPEKLIDQLAPNGIMVVPVGSEFHQELFQIRKKDGKITAEERGACVFVKLIGQEGWQLE